MATIELLDGEWKEAEKEQAKYSEKERSQDRACLPWHVLLPLGNASTILMNTSVLRVLFQCLFPFDEELC